MFRECEATDTDEYGNNYRCCRSASSHAITAQIGGDTFILDTTNLCPHHAKAYLANAEGNPRIEVLQIKPIK